MFSLANLTVLRKRKSAVEYGLSPVMVHISILYEFEKSGYESIGVKLIGQIRLSIFLSEYFIICFRVVFVLVIMDVLFVY